MRRITAAATCMCLCATLGACGSRTEAAPTSEPAASAARAAGDVAMFVPEDGFTIAQDVPLNTWHDLTRDTADALADHGFAAKDVSTHADRDLDAQSRAVQDYVVEHVSGAARSGARPATIVLSPVAERRESTKYYGDYVSLSLRDDEDAKPALERMTRALELARSNGMHVVVLATPLPGFTPDVFVSLSRARDIGRMQARQLVGKLRLDTTSRYNPKYVEILLPVDGEAERGDDEQRFAADAFAGAWEVLGPYFRSGVLLSPSMATTASTKDDDWRAVAVDAGDGARVRRAFAERLGKGADGSRVRIDGVLAMNDFVASSVVAELGDLGYTGSAADVNPSITIGDVVANMTGRQDLQRSRVPDPQKAPSDADAHEQAQARVQDRWPIVTGYGAYVSNLPNIVDGKQWMTGLVDRAGTADDLARVCAALNASEDPGDLDFVDVQDLYGADVPTMSLPLVAVSAGNLKTALIDPGYISLADAGL